LITDIGESGRKMNRPGLQRLLSLIAEGNVQCVLVSRLDRLTRSQEDFARLLERFDRHGVVLVSVDKCFDSRSSAGRSFTSIMPGFAKFGSGSVCYHGTGPRKDNGQQSTNRYTVILGKTTIPRPT
jgi:DNA invertase Pin-like site-specific DNA recombinase